MQTKALILTLFLTLGLILTGCGKQEESALATGAKKPVAVSLSTYSTASFSPMNFFVKNSYAAVSDLKFCFKRLRFKKDLVDTVDPLIEDNIDLNLGQVSISTLGTSLGTVQVPVGTYKRVEFDLERDCDGTTKNSVDIINDTPYSGGSTDRITIKFDGNFIVDGEESLELGVQNILDAANAYDGTGTIKDAFQAVSGNL